MKEQSQFQVYNASAGSGKTFTLVKEYLKIVLSTENHFRFQNILAITFTNKAAAEMKERVLKNLHDFTIDKGNDMMQLISEEIGLTKSVLKNRSQSVLNGILQNYSAFNITTIDSFTHRIIRSFAFDLGLSLNFEVELDANVLLDEAVDLLISKIGEDNDLTNVLIDYSLDKTDDDKSWDISRDLKEFSRILLNENHIKHVKLLENKTVKDYASLKNKLNKEQKKLELKFSDIGKEATTIIKNMDLEPKDFYRSMLPNHFMNLEVDFKKAKFFDQSKLRERIEENTFYSKSKPETIKTAIESILPLLLGLYSESEKIYQKFILNELVLKSVIPLAVLKHINNSLTEIKEQNNIRLNAEFNQLISNQIKDEPAPFIYERIGEKFKYYFIDEMQDTSELQWQNLIPLIENSLTSESIDGQRGKLMLVGDAKQAIYRWRGGKAEQFISLSKKNKDSIFSVNKELKNLETNYRSYSEVIDFNNRFFTHVSGFLENENYGKMYVSGNRQEETNKKGGYVQLSFVDLENEETEKELIYPQKVLETILNLDEGFNRGDICVLVRTKKQGIEISDYLAENNIPLISSETLLLKNNERVNFLTNIFLSISNANNKKAMANALFYLAGNLNVTTETHQFLMDKIHLNNDEIFNSLINFGFNFSVKEFTSQAFYDAVEYTIRSFNLLDGPDAFVQSFLDFILEYEQKRGFGLNDFLEHWERKKEKLSIAIPEGQDAVSVMTVHKSKGLEFPVVIFPYDLNIYKEINPKIWYDNLDQNDYLGFETSFINYSKKVSYTSEYGAQIFDARRQELQLDNLNLLYVVMTRSIEQLYVLTSKQKKEKELKESVNYSDLFVDFLKSTNNWNNECLTYSFGNNKKTSLNANEVKKETIIEQKKFISSSWKNKNISIVTSSSTLWDSEQGLAIEHGNLIHEILSKIKVEEDIEEVLYNYIYTGILDEKLSIKIEETLYSIVRHPDLEKYYRNRQEILNEQELVSESKIIQIPDRLWINNGKVVIIDYKTGNPQEKYHRQLNEYAYTLINMGLSVEKKLLIYIGQQILIEELKD